LTQFIEHPSACKAATKHSLTVISIVAYHSI